MTAMRASVIILNWNGLHVLKPCLAAIEANTAMDDYEVIVLDNGSAEQGIEDVVRPYPRVRLLKEPVNHGFSKGNNIAARASLGKYLVILNNDTVPARGWLEPLLDAVRDDVGIAGARLVDHDGRVLYSGGYFDPSISAYVPAYRNYPAEAAAEARECETYIACGIALRRDLFEAVGGFDEHYFQGYEDIDLCLKVRDRGLKIMYCPGSVIEHIENVSMNKMETGERRRSKENNRRYFESRWRHRIHEFRLRHPPPGLDDFSAREDFDDALFQAVPRCAGEILHLACGTGVLGERIKRTGKASRVTGVEADTAAARIASTRLDEVIESGIEDVAWESMTDRVDVLVFSAVLEKARDPWGLLFRLRGCLKSGGIVVARFHNVAHYKLARRLALRDWRYEPGGVLDHANLRFFSRGSIEDLFTYSGFEVTRLEPASTDQPFWRFASAISTRARELSASGYIVTARRRPGRAA
jgi:GT2 family glycosyltransferase